MVRTEASEISQYLNVWTCNWILHRNDFALNIYLHLSRQVPYCTFPPLIRNQKSCQTWSLMDRFQFQLRTTPTCHLQQLHPSESWLTRLRLTRAVVFEQCRRENKECLWCLSTVCLLCRVIRTQTWTSLWFSNNEVSGCASNSCEPEASDCSKHLVSDRCLYSCLCMMSVRGDGPNVVRLSVYWGEPIREKVAHRLRKQRQWMNWEAPSYKSCELLCSSRMKNMQVEISIIGPL